MNFENWKCQHDQFSNFNFAQQMFEYDQRTVMQWNANGVVDDLNNCDPVLKMKKRAN